MLSSPAVVTALVWLNRYPTTTAGNNQMNHLFYFTLQVFSFCLLCVLLPVLVLDLLWTKRRLQE